MIKDQLIAAYHLLINHGIEVDAIIEDFTIRNLFVEMFNIVPNTYDTRHSMFYGLKNIDFKETIKNIEEKCATLDCVIISHNLDKLFILEKLMFYIREDDNIAILTSNKLFSIDDIPSIIKDNIVLEKNEDHLPTYNYITHSSSFGFNTTSLSIKKFNVDLSLNYNDDLPHQQIIDFLTENNNSGLIILHGEPGTGKSSYIRHLISIIDKEFFVIDQNVFNFLTDSTFVNLLLKHKNSIFILEDCEAMLSDRLAGNSKIASLLNMTDGIIGDSFNFKFICTFNTSLINIDKALLRKGRMKYKYEFTTLTEEKTINLGKKLNINTKLLDGKRLTLAELYNFNDSDFSNETNKKQIGFEKKIKIKKLNNSTESINNKSSNKKEKKFKEKN